METEDKGALVILVACILVSAVGGCVFGQRLGRSEIGAQWCVSRGFAQVRMSGNKVECFTPKSPTQEPNP